MELNSFCAVLVRTSPGKQEFREEGSKGGRKKSNREGILLQSTPWSANMDSLTAKRSCRHTRTSHVAFIQQNNSTMQIGLAFGEASVCWAQIYSDNSFDL